MAAKKNAPKRTPAKRNTAAKALKDARYRPRVVENRKKKEPPKRRWFGWFDAD
ncbi:MAG TPA: hypothetical protein VHP58_05960 [Alphaproteobacteria bacterium]|nr:hypothetical protein [Alphaproteobacteria bacterium]